MAIILGTGEIAVSKSKIIFFSSETKGLGHLTTYREWQRPETRFECATTLMPTGDAVHTEQSTPSCVSKTIVTYTMA